MLTDRRIPRTTTLLDQVHNALDRKLFVMKGFHHPDATQPAFLVGLALFYNLMLYQHCAKRASRCGVAMEGGKLSTGDWLLNCKFSPVEAFEEQYGPAHRGQRPTCPLTYRRRLLQYAA